MKYFNDDCLKNKKIPLSKVVYHLTREIVGKVPLEQI
jgi:hypothetical protein